MCQADQIPLVHKAVLILTSYDSGTRQDPSVSISINNYICWG